jgi:PKD repeat protein
MSLTANFKASPPSGETPLTISFTDLSIGNPTSWQWIFGDGTGSTEQNPTHVYQNPDSGTAKKFSVVLIVGNGTKLMQTTKTIVVTNDFPFIDPVTTSDPFPTWAIVLIILIVVILLFVLLFKFSSSYKPKTSRDNGIELR